MDETSWSQPFPVGVFVCVSGARGQCLQMNGASG